MTADSGDKHDYMSMGPYWWPDPSKPDGLPYIRKDGQRNPELDKLDRNKLGDMSKAVTTLGLAYYFSGDEKYAAKSRRLPECLVPGCQDKDESKPHLRTNHPRKE